MFVICSRTWAAMLEVCRIDSANIVPVDVRPACKKHRRLILEGASDRWSEWRLAIFFLLDTIAPATLLYGANQGPSPFSNISTTSF